jgi:hypothetical protein
MEEMQSGIGFHEDYKRVVQQAGVRTTFCANRFEVVAAAGNDITEQNVVQMLRQWVRWRKDEMRQSGDLPE